MIGGILIDLLVVGAVVAFAWGATQLGGITTVGRLAEVTVAFAVAALLRDPAGEVVESLLGASVDFCNLVGMLLVGLGTWIAAHSIFRWWRANRVASRMSEDDGEFHEEEADPLDSPNVARVAGGLLGLGWSLLFVAMLVLQPADTPISRSAIDSRVGGMLINGEDTLMWLRDGFPHYTQTLPKGKIGAIVGEKSDLPMHEPVEAKEIPGDADDLLRSINELRRNERVRRLEFNPDIAAVARRHALALAEAQQLSYELPGGGELDARVQSALGEVSGSFTDEVGNEIVWAHNPNTAMGGLLASSRAQSLLTESRWSEIGIGVADAGWFNGRIYVLLLVGGIDDEELEEGSANEADSLEDGQAGAADALGIPAPTDTETSTSDECVEPTPTDIDGDGAVDEESVDPALVDCADQDTSTSTPPVTPPPVQPSTVN